MCPCTFPKELGMWQNSESCNFALLLFQFFPSSSAIRSSCKGKIPTPIQPLFTLFAVKAQLKINHEIQMKWKVALGAQPYVH